MDPKGEGTIRLSLVSVRVLFLKNNLKHLLPTQKLCGISILHNLKTKLQSTLFKA